MEKNSIFYPVSACGLLLPHVHGSFTILYYPAVIHCQKRVFLLYFNWWKIGDCLFGRPCSRL